MVIALLFTIYFLVEVQTILMECRKLEDGYAPTTMDSTETTLWNFVVQIGKVAGLGIDGAAVIVGDLNGVRSNGWSKTFCVHVYCVCNRCHLAVLQTCKGIALVESCSTLLSQVYTYVAVPK